MGVIGEDFPEKIWMRNFQISFIIFSTFIQELVPDSCMDLSLGLGVGVSFPPKSY